MDVNEFENFPSGGPHITNTAYFRYKIAELLPNVSKIIYLDCDIIVKQSLSQLFETDLTGFWLGGVEDVGYYYWRNYNPEYIHNDCFYINTGMLLINLDAWREEHLYEKLMDYTVNEVDKIAIGDQDVINIVCKGKIKELDYKWNVQDSFYREKPEREFNPNCKKIIDASLNPAIIHYTYIKKPWNNESMPRALDWIYYDCLKNHKLHIYFCIKYKSYIKILKEFLKIIFSIVNGSQNHKVLTILGIKFKLRRK